MEIKAVGNYEATWGEGPIWWEGRLVYVDIETHKVISYDPDSGTEEKWGVGQRIGTVVPREQGGFVIAGDNGFTFLTPEKQEIIPIGDPEPDKEDNRFNDGKCSPDGHFFAGTISLVKNEGDAALYRLSPDLEIEEAFGPVTNSNGIVWNAAGDTVFYIDTPRKAVLRFDYADGLLDNEREAFSTEAIDASPDGMAIDADGNLWIAFCHGGCVVCFDPETGDELKRIDLHCLETTACAFGGPDLEDLYVTTGIHKTEEEAEAGRLFGVKGLGVKGLPANAFAG